MDPPHLPKKVSFGEVRVTRSQRVRTASVLSASRHKDTQSVTVPVNWQSLLQLRTKAKTEHNLWSIQLGWHTLGEFLHWRLGWWASQTWEKFLESVGNILSTKWDPGSISHSTNEVSRLWWCSNSRDKHSQTTVSQCHSHRPQWVTKGSLQGRGNLLQS